MINEIATLPLLVIWLALGAVGIVIQAFVRDNTRLVFGYYLGTLALTGILSMMTAGSVGLAFGGMISVGGYGAYFDTLFCATGILSMLAARPYLQREDSEQDEFYTLLVSAVAGMMLMAHSRNLVSLFVGIELMSISFYVMAGFFRKSIKSVESALKYFLLGAFSTGFLVYGMSLVYGGSGSMDFTVIRDTVLAGTLTYPMLFTIGGALIVVGLSFKIAAFPFHQWAPDVYEGAPTVVTAFMSTGGKAAAFSALIPIVDSLSPSVDPASGKLKLALAVIAAITMLWGNISAIVQANVKRMLAYSSIAHAGYMLLGIVAGTREGFQGIIFYATAYVFMQMGAFVIVGILERNGTKFLDMADYNGLAKRHPAMAALMAIFMFSLAGIPPLAGFYGKYTLFVSAVDAGYTWLAIVGVVSSVISAYFYLGLIGRMYFAEPTVEESEAPAGIAGVTLLITGIAVFVIGLFPSIILNFLAYL